MLKGVHLQLGRQSKQANKQASEHTHTRGHVQCSSIRAGLLRLTQEFSIYSQEVLDSEVYTVESSKMMFPI